MSSCRLFKAVGLVNTCGDESPTVPQEPSSGEQELGESDAYAASELKSGFTNKLTSPNGEYSTIFTKSGLYIINNKTKKKSLVYSVKLDNINDPVLDILDGSLYLITLTPVAKARKILPIGAAADDTCKIKPFVKLTDSGVLIGPPCGSYNTIDFV